jgi:diaminopimelate decarboxylase
MLIDSAAEPYAALAARYGTPLLVIDTERLDRTIAAFSSAARAADVTVCYAAKALFFVALARRMASTDLWIDVCSLGELVTAERGGLPAGRLVFHGCGKTAEELAAIAAGRVAHTVVDHIDELRALAAAAAGGPGVRLLLRVNTGIEAHTHDFVRTSGRHTKFGFLPEEIDEAIDAVRAAPELQLAGVHAHIGSQIFEEAAFDANLSALLDVYAAIASRNETLGEISAGGGFGVEADGTAFDAGAAIARLGATLDREARRRGLPRPRLAIEPGRAIVAGAGTSLYRVISVKARGARRFVIVDGSIADNPRPALYGAQHPPRLAGRSSAAPLAPATVCGRSCESDVLAEAELPADLQAGDLLAFSTTGAYTYSMASNYNRFARPAIAFCDARSDRLVVRREPLDAILANDLDA